MKLQVNTIGLGLLGSTWVGFQVFVDAPPPVLNQIMVASLGVWFTTMALEQQRRQSSDANTPTEAPVDWTNSADKPIEQTFFCATGDHLVDEVIWLEQVALGCKPCMLKLRETLTKDRDITMRLWRGNPDGTLTQIPADPKKKPLSAKTSATTPASIQVSMYEKLRNTRPGSPTEYIRKHQDWTCTQCGRGFDDTSAGYYNTQRGFVCKKCSGTAIKGVKPVSGLTKNAPRRKSVKADGGPYTVDKTSVSAGEVVKASGGRTSIRIRGDVGPGALVKASGGNCRIIIDGDVYQSAIISASGGSGEIIVKGYIYDYALVKASGSSCRINHHGHAATAEVKASGGSATVSDLGSNRDGDGGAMDFTRYQAPGPIATTKREWSIAEKGVRENGNGTFLLATCTECGLLDTDNPVIGWNRTPPGYKCVVCLSGRTPVEAKREYHKWRVRNRRELPKAPKDRETYYIIDDNEVVTWFDGTWVRVLIPK